MSEYVSVPREPTREMVIAGGKELERLGDSGHYEGRGRAVCAYKAMLAAAPAEQRTDQAGCVMTALTDALDDRQIDVTSRALRPLLDACYHPLFDALCAQAKRANALEAEVERLRKENGEYNGDVADATAQYKFQLHRAESAERRYLDLVDATHKLATQKVGVERRLAVAVGALKAQWHYSDHTNQCAIQAPAPDEEPLCDCGYDEAKLLYDEVIKEVK